VRAALNQTHELGETDIVSSPINRRNRANTLIFQSIIFYFLVGMGTSIVVVNSAAAAPPPIAENAYCDKGDIPKFGDKDGPAQLPKACYYTGLDGTPSPGKEIHVPANADLHEAVDSAKCGDTLLLAAGASYEIRDLPAKKCDNQHYITIRTDAPDSKLPPEGTRISPAWAGVASLPGRPPYAQPPGGPAKLMPTLIVKLPSGAKLGDHYRFIGIEWSSSMETHIARLITTESADHLIFDRNWLHPPDGAEMNKGIGMVQGTHAIAVINSYFSGFYCIARTGTCTDSSALGGGNAEVPIGTLKIFNNFLEASGENILFGGAASEINPTDIEIRRNHLFRPMLWKEGEPGYTPARGGNPVIVKNHFELKSGIRVLFEANLLENCWGGFTQTGSSILLTPRNQSNKCPKCEVTDVTLRYNRIRNVAGVIQVANGLSKEGGSTADGGRYSIHDLLVDGLHDEGWKGQGTFAIVVSNAPLLHDVSFDHITAFVTGSLFYVGDKEQKIPNFSVTNSIFLPGKVRFEFASTGGGQANCAHDSERAGAEAVLSACFVNWKFEKNLIIGEKGGWPKGTVVVSSAEAAGIKDFKDGVSKDPRLCHAKEPGCSKVSPGASAATDGKDIGADVDALDAALAGVE
jgi:hypothetical protein